MRVKIRLNNKKFLGEGLLIGSRLYEGEAPNGQTAPTTNGQTTPVTNGQTTTNPTQTPALPAVNNGQGQSLTGANQNNGLGLSQQGNVAQQLQQIYIKHFQGLQAAIANDLKTVQGVQWAQNVQPKDQSFNGIMAALQEYMKANVEAAKKAVEVSAQLQNNNQTNTQNSSTTAPAQ